MQLIKPKRDETWGIHAISEQVKDPRKHMDVAAEMTAWLDENNGKFQGYYNSGFAIAHCQVAEKPLKLFVVAKELIGEEGEGKTKLSFLFPARAIWNAEIVSAPVKVTRMMPKREVKYENHQAHVHMSLEEKEVMNSYMVKEACMSFPYRNEKNVERNFRIKVRYQIIEKGLFNRDKVTTVTEWVEGLKAHIFQHETDHFAGKEIYHKEK